MPVRMQSAIEFMSVYGIVLLIIAIMIAILVFFISIPRTLLPVECTYFNTFTCADAVLAVNGSHSATLLVESVDSIPGVINVSEFRGFLSFQSSKPGYCIPNQAQQGQTIYCIANFNFTPSISQTYFGTFVIYANYCAAAPTLLLSEPCPASKNYTFTGNIRVQPSNAKIGGINTTTSGNATGIYVPISVANNNGIGAAPAHFQEEITFDPQEYALMERPDLGNLRFYYGSRELNSWCESGCTSTSSNVIFWVRMPVAVPPGKNRTIAMYFLPFTATYTGIYAGEAPQLSPTYGEYDNGASVFSEYWNFRGTSMPAGFSVIEPAGSSITVDDGLTVATPSASYAGVIYNYNLTSPSVLEADISSVSGVAAGIAEQTGNLSTSDGYDFNYWSGSISEGSMESGMSGTQNINLQVTTGIMGEAWASSSSQVYYKNYVAYDATATDLTLPTGIYVSAGVYCCSSGSSITLRWMRVRMYPPSGIMPVTTFGNVVTVT